MIIMSSTNWRKKIYAFRFDKKMLSFFSILDENDNKTDQHEPAPAFNNPVKEGSS